MKVLKLFYLVGCFTNRSASSRTITSQIMKYCLYAFRVSIRHFYLFVWKSSILGTLFKLIKKFNNLRFSAILLFEFLNWVKVLLKISKYFHNFLDYFNWFRNFKFIWEYKKVQELCLFTKFGDYLYSIYLPILYVLTIIKVKLFWIKVYICVNIPKSPMAYRYLIVRSKLWIKSDFKALRKQLY